MSIRSNLAAVAAVVLLAVALAVAVVGAVLPGNAAAVAVAEPVPLSLSQDYSAGDWACGDTLRASGLSYGVPLATSVAAGICHGGSVVGTLFEDGSWLIADVRGCVWLSPCAAASASDDSGVVA